jgi:hypothetical protein
VAACFEIGDEEVESGPVVIEVIGA